MDEEVLSILDSYLGDLIEDIVEKYGYDIDIEEEYEELLWYIYRRLKRAWFGGRRPTYSEWEKVVREARTMPHHLEVLLSYLISRYTLRRSKTYKARYDI